MSLWPLILVLLTLQASAIVGHEEQNTPVPSSPPPPSPPKKLSIGKFWVLLLFLLLLTFLDFDAAIIGGGVGGNAAGYFLSDLLERKLPEDAEYEIDLYEASNRLGGRLRTIDIDGRKYEAGGSVIHPRNRYAVDLAARLGLDQRGGAKDFLDHLCITNGKRYVFCESYLELVTKMRMFLRYGFDPIRLSVAVEKVLDNFERIYARQDEEHAYDNVEDLLAAMHETMVNLTRVSYRKHLVDTCQLGDSFIEEIAQAVTLVNYGQLVSVPAFVGLVSFAGAGDALWSIKGGNQLLAEQLANNSVVRVKLNRQVARVTYLGDHRYKLEHKPSRSEVSPIISTTYDYIIIANPLVRSEFITVFDNFTRASQTLLSNIIGHHSMHQTVASFVQGRIKPAFEDLSIIACNVDKPEQFFISLSRLQPADDGQQESSSDAQKSYVYKLFSKRPLTKLMLMDYFERIDRFETLVWRAYPEYDSTRRPLPPFVIRPGMYYINAIEWAASAIEMSLIGAKNVALLVCHELGLCRPQPGDNLNILNNNNNKESTPPPNNEKTEL